MALQKQSKNKHSLYAFPAPQLIKFPVAQAKSHLILEPLSFLGYELKMLVPAELMHEDVRETNFWRAEQDPGKGLCNSLEGQHLIGKAVFLPT